MNLGGWEWAILALIAVLLIGGYRLGGVGSELTGREPEVPNPEPQASPSEPDAGPSDLAER